MMIAAADPADHALPELAPAPPFSPSDRERIAAVEPWVQQTATRFELDPELIQGVIWVESRFQPRAESPAGARGLMQLMPATADAMVRELGRPLGRIYDPELNIEAGSLYLLKLLDRFDGDETLALAAYNAGAGNVGRWMAEDGELPPRSLQYVENVQRARMRFVAMRQERQMPGITDDRTLLAAAPARVAPEVPAPPTSGRPRPAPAEPPPVDPLAPSPDVYRPAPTPEVPLADTPYPPIRPSLDEPKAPEQPQAPARPGRARALPSVLD
jgi:Transglycosylase SLT domain